MHPALKTLRWSARIGRTSGDYSAAVVRLGIRFWPAADTMIETDNLYGGAPEPRVVTQQKPVQPGRGAGTRIAPQAAGRICRPEKAREQLEIFIEAAKRRKEALDHVLLFGPPGLGKTTLAHIVAREMGVNLRQTSGPVLERAGTWPPC